MLIDKLNNAITHSDSKSHQPNTLLSSDFHKRNQTLVAPNVEPLFLNKLEPQQARDFLLNTILKKVGAAPSNTRATNVQPYINHYSPQSSANSIISQLNKLFMSDSAQSPTKIADAIKHSLSETKEALHNEGLLTEEISEDLDSVVAEVMNYLKTFQRPEFESNAINYSQYQASSETSIDIETADGDVVTIDIAASLMKENGSVSVNRQSTNAYLSASYTEKNVNLSYSVTGELDEAEMAAIDKLVGQIAKTTSLYEKGNVETALNMAKNLELDSETLAGFQFSVKTHEQYRAVDVYERTERIGSAPSASHMEKPNTETALPSIMEMLSPENKIMLKNPLMQIEKLFSQFYEQMYLLGSTLEKDSHKPEPATSPQLLQN